LKEELFSFIVGGDAAKRCFGVSPISERWQRVDRPTHRPQPDRVHGGPR
jgi:hypothetical protein